MPTPQPDDSLSRTLAEWRLNPARNPQFRAAVWGRIRQAGRPVNWSRFARTHPAFVTVVLAAAIAAGAWRGRTEAREQMEASRTAIAATYVHALDARWMRQP